MAGGRGWARPRQGAIRAWLRGPGGQEWRRDPGDWAAEQLGCPRCLREGPLRSQARGEGTPAVARRREGAGEQREAGKQVSGVSWVLSVGTGGSSVLMARCHSSCPFPWTAEGGGHSVGIHPGVSIPRELQTFILFCSSRSHNLDTVLQAGLGMQPWAQSSRQEGSPKVDPQGAHRGQAERHKTELRPLEEDPAEGHPSQGADLHGGTVVGRTTPLGVSPTAGTVRVQELDAWCESRVAPPPLRTPTWSSPGAACRAGPLSVPSGCQGLQPELLPGAASQDTPRGEGPRV